MSETAWNALLVYEMLIVFAIWFPEPVVGLLTKTRIGRVLEASWCFIREGVDVPIRLADRLFDMATTRIEKMRR